jgi:radical SAM superfamily enzyme YgiQ (UPF0313 family)
MAKVFLLQAAIHAVHVERSQPLGLLHVASGLRAAGHDVRLHDMRLNWTRPDLALAALDAARPDVVGVSAHGVDAPAMHRFAAAAKRRAPSVPVICGGVHGTAYWAEVLKDSAIDAVVIGEGEAAVAEAVDALAAGRPLGDVPGLAVRADGAVIRTTERLPSTDLDRFPFPAWDLVDVAAYGRFPRIGIIGAHPRYMAVETARGCPFHCAWCLRPMGDRFRPRSAEYVVEMLETLRREHDVRDVLIVDDLFNFDPDRVRRIFELLLEKNLGLAIAIPNGLRADLLAEDDLKRMRRAGVYRIMVAVETGSPRLQKEMNKRLDLEKTRKVIASAARLGISTHGNFIVGLPGETKEEVWTTVRYAARSDLDTFGLYRAIPFRGTALAEMAERQGFALPEGKDFLSFWDLDLNLSATTLGAVNRARKWAYPLFYLRPRRLWRLLRHLPDPARQVPFLVWFFLKKLFSE